MPRARNRLRLRHELFHRFFHAGLIAMEYGSVDSAWADTVDANLVLGKFHRRRPRQVDDAGLRRAVRMQPVESPNPRDGSRRDYRPAADFAHLGRRMLHAQEHAAQQDRLALVPVLDGDLFERSDRAADSGVVVDHVETPELTDSARDESLDFSFGGLAAFDVKVRDHHRRAFTGELYRRRAPNPARRACNNRHFALEPIHFRFPLLMRFTP